MIHLADVSEFQGIVDWPTYGHARAAVIVRAHSGYRRDHHWQQNRDGARANVRIRGWYQYLVASVTPETQAAGFCNAIDTLRPGEFVVVDCEEGAGSQAARVQAWMNVVDQRLHTRSWIYAGEAFAGAHLGGLTMFADRHTWIAAYRAHPPVLPYTLWQHTDKEVHPGIRLACDCSIFDGTADEFAALVGETPAPTPVPAPPSPNFQEATVMGYLHADDAYTGGHWLCHPDNGEVYAFDTDWQPTGRYLGGLNNHPDWDADHDGKPGVGGIVGFGYWSGDGSMAHGRGYAIVTRTGDGQFHPYKFPGDASLVTA